MPTGTVTKFLNDRGYGFLKPDDGGKDIFVHMGAVTAAGLNNLAIGQRLQFDIGADRGDPSRQRAVNLKIAA